MCQLSQYFVGTLVWFTTVTIAFAIGIITVTVTATVTGFCTSSYVDILRNTQIRKDFIKFCISNHNLCIEVGRHCKPKVPREERLCKVCVQNEIEDEIHLLFHCTKYEYIRKQFIAKQSQIWNLTSFDDYKKLCYILFTTSNKTSIHCTAKYISKCLLLRDK